MFNGDGKEQVKKEVSEETLIEMVKALKHRLPTIIKKDKNK